MLVRPEDVTIGPGGQANANVRAARYRGGAWEATLDVAGLAAPLAVAARGRLAVGEIVRIGITGGWALSSQPPGHDPGRQPSA